MKGKGEVRIERIKRKRYDSAWWEEGMDGEKEEKKKGEDGEIKGKRK